MKQMEIRYLENWPPIVGGAHERGSIFPIAGEGGVDDLIPLDGVNVTFSGDFKGHVNTYHFVASDENMAKEVFAVIAANLGKTVAEIGALKIEVETKAAGNR